MPLVELPGFEDAVRRHTYRGTRALCLYDGRKGCSHCNAGWVVRLEPFSQGALFYHAGYGATERKTVEVCLACARVSVVRVETTNPRFQ